MKIADGLELIKSLGKEKSRLENIAEHEAWAYRSQDPNSKWEPTFDMEANHREVRNLDKKIRKLSRAINAANNLIDIPGLKDEDYQEWF